jgi:hypothetical protein
VGDDKLREPAPSASSGLVQGKEGRPRHERVVSKSDQQGDVSLEQHQPGLLAHPSHRTGKIDQLPVMPPWADCHGNDPSGAEEAIAPDQDLVHRLEEGLQIRSSQVGGISRVPEVALDDALAGDRPHPSV